MRLQTGPLFGVSCIVHGVPLFAYFFVVALVRQASSYHCLTAGTRTHKGRLASMQGEQRVTFANWLAAAMVAATERSGEAGVNSWWKVYPGDMWLTVSRLPDVRASLSEVTSPGHKVLLRAHLPVTDPGFVEPARSRAQRQSGRSGEYRVVALGWEHCIASRISLEGNGCVRAKSSELDSPILVAHVTCAGHQSMGSSLREDEGRWPHCGTLQTSARLTNIATSRPFLLPSRVLKGPTIDEPREATSWGVHKSSFPLALYFLFVSCSWPKVLGQGAPPSFSLGPPSLGLIKVVSQTESVSHKQRFGG